MFEKKRNSQTLHPKKEWFILIDNQKEGPYSIEDLKKEHRFNPDTLVWKAGFPKWMPARSVFDLQDVFADEKDEEGTSEDENSHVIRPNLRREEEVILTLQPDPYQYILLLLLALLIFLYALYQLTH